jgi:hypothetical protein
MSTVHEAPPRGGEQVPEGPTFKPGKFGRLCPSLPAFRPGRERLAVLGRAMRAPAASDPSGDNPRIPAGYTYLLRLIDHDLTLDVTPLGELAADPLAIEHFRSPRLDLDAVYGLGPVQQPYLYTRASDRTKFAIGRTRPAPDTAERPVLGPLDNDLPRSDGFALIGDPRNDDNLILAQLHLALLKFHNRIVDRLAAGAASPGTLFAQARRLVTWHYQWIALHDLLPRLVDPAVLGDVLSRGRRFYRFADHAFIPVECSAAAFRLVPSMERDEYSYNRIFNPGAVRRDRATLARLRAMTGLTGAEVPVASHWVIDWRRFVEGLPKIAGIEPHFNLSRKITPLIADALHRADDGEPSVTERTLLRGASLGLPSGQAVARFMNEAVLAPDRIATGPDGRVARAQGFDEESPLWYYLLKEAQIAGGGERLGPVGSRILAEVWVGVLQADPASFLSVDPRWHPSVRGAEPGAFTLADLLTFVDDLNPLGE